MFYIFIDEDARKISKITLLKLVNLSNDIVKCGFPSNSLDKYLSVFNNMSLDVLIVDSVGNDNSNDEEKVIRKIKRLDIENITPVKALNILFDMKEMLSNE